jgi:phenylalanyl-tRNA synthetase beta chain
MRLLVSWVRDFVDVTASPEEIAEKLSMRGFEVASIEQMPEPLAEGDAVIDFEVTANRPDCLSVLGFAREIATLYDLPLRLPSSESGAKIALRSTAAGDSQRLKVSVEDTELCPRYAAAIADLTPGASPAWLTSRLQAAGVRPINPIVDITNYVLIELGHPMHAFDLAKLAGAELRIRRAKRGEIITTLDGVERKLEPEMLVIADANRAQAIAGVMGGAASEVSPATTVVAFESAYFKPASVRRTSKRLGLKTEASSRFERGADVSVPVVALERAIALMEQLGAGRMSGPIVDRYPHVRQPAQLHLRRARLARLLGTEVADREVERILRHLGLGVTPTPDGWDVIAPTFRVDLSREADLIEEVGRHHGFDALAPTFPAQTAPAPPPDPRIPRDRLVRRVLTAAGLSEAVTFGFIEAKAAELFAQGAAAGLVSIANPLSAKFDTLRASLLPGVVDSVAHNRRHGRADVGLFEIGARFSAIDGETRGVGLAWTGHAADDWKSGSRSVDFFDVKGVVERLCGALGVSARFEPIEPTRAPFLVPGQAAAVFADGVDGAAGKNGTGGAPAGVIGLLAPAIADERGAPRQDEIFVAELNLDALWAARTPRDEAVAPLPRHPFVVRDLSIVVADTLPAEIISGTIHTAGRASAAPLVGVRFFDRYQGKSVPDGKVSLSVRLTFQAPDRTLTDADVQQSFDRIVAALAGAHGAVQR